MTPELSARIVADSRDRVAWIRARSRGITATDVAQLTSGKAIDRAADAKLMGSGLSGNAYTDHGRRREPEIAAWVAATHGIPRSRVDEVIELTGLQNVGGKRAGGFSLGMGQRLGIASALLGDPRTLVLDEPVNGLDPEGVRWVRQFVRALAAEGRTVLLSSHLMSEMAQTADHVIVLGRGQVLADAPLSDLVRAWTTPAVTVRSPRASDLVAAIDAPDVGITTTEPGLLQVTGVTAARIGDIAAAAGIPLHELTPASGSLEEAYMALTEQAVEYKSKELS